MDLDSNQQPTADALQLSDNELEQLDELEDEDELEELEELEESEEAGQCTDNEQQSHESDEDYAEQPGRKRKAVRQAAGRKKKSSKGPQPGGGTHALGSKRRMLGRYSSSMQRSCGPCGGVPHQAGLQQPDEVMNTFLKQSHQGEDVNRVLKDWTAKLKMSRSKGEFKLTKNVEPHQLLQDAAEGQQAKSYLKKRVSYSIQPYQLALPVTYAVHHLQQPYDDVLFTTLAKDIFHLNSTQPEARWVQNLDDAADVEAAQQKLAELLGTTLRGWYEKHSMWTLTRHAAPTSDAEVPDQPALQGVFTDEFTATDYLAEALGSRFQLAPARSLSDELETTPADQWLLAINRALAQHDGAPDVLMKLFKGMDSVAHGNESWLVCQMFRDLMHGAGDSEDSSAAAAASGGSSRNVDAAGEGSNDTAGAADSAGGSVYKQYWADLKQHLQQTQPLGQLPTLPGSVVHPLFWRLAAVALNRVIHVIHADDVQPKLLVFPALEVATKVKTLTEDGKIRWRHVAGLQAPCLELLLGVDHLPSSLADGITFVESEGLLILWEKDLDQDLRPMRCAQYPAEILIEFVEARRRFRKSTDTGGDVDEDMSVVYKALAKLRNGDAVYQLEHSPFSTDEPVYLMDILDKVEQAAQGQSAYSAAKQVCKDLGLDVQAREDIAQSSPAAAFRDLLEVLLAANPPDMIVQLAAALLPHVPQLDATHDVADELPAAAMDVPTPSVLTDGYLQTIGPRPDGSWGSVPFSMFTRLCQLVIQSNKDADFSWSAGRALMRILGLDIQEVESRQYATVDLVTSLSVQQRLVNLALEVTLAKAHATMKGYYPYFQQHLRVAWARMHRQQQQQQQQQQQDLHSGNSSNQQSGQYKRQWPLKSCMVTVENFKHHIELQEQPGSRRMQAAFPRVLGSANEQDRSSTGGWGEAFKAAELPEVQCVRDAFCSGRQISDDALQDQLSYNLWDKHVFASSWLQKQQHILTFGNLAEGDELHKAPDVDREEATRRKAENTRRQALNIAPANFRPRPELGTDEVALQIVKSTLDKATTDASCKRAIGTIGRHMTGLATLCRGQEVRHMRLSGMSSLEYPIRRRSLQSQYSSGASQLHGQQKQRNDSMKCLAFTNTMGKSNPGDKVDMDVPGRNNNPLLDATFWIFWQLIITFSRAAYDMTIDAEGNPELQAGMGQPDFNGQEWMSMYIWWEQEPHQPIASTSVLQNLNRMLRDAGVDTIKKQHYARKYKLLLLRTLYNTPLPDLDSVGHWSTNVRDQHYALLPGRDVVANLLGFHTADEYWIPRDDLDPSQMDEFKDMVNSILPWLGRASAQVLEAMRRAPPGQRNYAAVDAVTALTKLRVWWFQTLPFLWRDYPDLPLWEWPVIRQLFDGGRFQRWCNVMWAYQDSCARAIELASKPAAALHFGPFYGPEQLTKLLAQHMEAFADYVMNRTTNPATDPNVAQMALMLKMKPQKFIKQLDEALCRGQSATRLQQQQQQQEHQQQQQHDASAAQNTRESAEYQQQQTAADMTDDPEQAYTGNEQQQQQQQHRSRTWQQQIPLIQPSQVNFDVTAAARAEEQKAADAAVQYIQLALDPDVTDANSLSCADQLLRLGGLLFQQANLDASIVQDSSDEVSKFNQWVDSIRGSGHLISGQLLQLTAHMESHTQRLAVIAAQQQELQLQQQIHMQWAYDAYVQQMGLMQELLQKVDHLVAQGVVHNEQLSHVNEGVNIVLLGNSGTQQTLSALNVGVQSVQQDMALVAANNMRLAGLPSSMAAKAPVAHSRKPGGKVASQEKSCADRAAGTATPQMVPGGLGAEAVQQAVAQVYESWPGLHKTPSELLRVRKKEGPVMGVTFLVQEWIKGIQLPGNKPGQRTAPVRQLEADQINNRGDRRWRSGPKIKLVIAWRKPIWLAYVRRILGHPLCRPTGTAAVGDVDGSSAPDGSSGSSSSSNGSFQGLKPREAVEDLEVLARLLAASEPAGDLGSREKCWESLQHKQPSYEKLHQYLSKHEWPAQVYEKLYWEAIYGSKQMLQQTAD